MLLSYLVQASLYGFFFTILALCFLLLKQLLFCYSFFTIFKKNGIPGPKPRLFLGNLWEFRSHDDPNQLIDTWFKKYGNVFGYFFGSSPRLVINDVDIIKDVMVRLNRNFRNRAPLSIEVKPLCVSLLAARDDDWKNQRRILTPAFSPSKIRLMTDSMNKSVDIMLEEISKVVKSEEEFEIYERVQALTLDVIGKCVLAMDVGCQRNLKDSFFQSVKEYFELCENMAVRAAAIFPPLSKLLRFVNDNLSAGKMTDSIVANLHSVIQKRRAGSKVGTADLLQLMLDSADEARTTNNGTKYHMDDYHAIANSHLFLLAGYETTATALAFTFYLLAKHQDVQDRLYDEVSSCLSNSQNPTYEDIAKMHYLEQVLYESMRIYPPVTLFITRVCGEECEINGLTIPKGVEIQVPVWHIHHDERNYPEPWKFDPDRFTPENKELMNPAAFLAFGIGPRNCIGMKFAFLEAKLTVARMVQAFHLQLSDKTEEPLEISCPNVISYPKKGVTLKASFR